MKNRSSKILQAALCFCGIGMAVQAHGQMVVVNVGINQPATLVANAGNPPATLCEGDTVTLGGSPTASGGMAPYTYAWSPGTGLSSTSVANPLAMPTSSGTYNLQITDANNCTATGNATISVVAAPVAAFTSAPGGGLSINFTDLSTGTITGWAWDFGDGATSTQQNPAHTYATPGQYTVCLTVTNSGCSVTTCTTLPVVVGLENAFAIPSLSVFPNPYQGATNVRFGMTEAAAVRLEAFDLSGKKVGNVFVGDLDAGEHTLRFSAADYGASAGVYMLRLSVGDAQATLRVHELR